MEIENEADEVEDWYLEHSQHNKKIPDKCSDCYKELKESGKVGDKNILEQTNLSILRERILAKQKERANEEAERKQGVIKNTPPKQIKEAPVITIENGAEFNLDRHTQLINRVDVLYSNFLLAQDTIHEEGGREKFDKAIKDLSVAYDDLLAEGLKVRF